MTRLPLRELLKLRIRGHQVRDTTGTGNLVTACGMTFDSKLPDGQPIRCPGCRSWRE